jgi:hypothetical protein
MDRRRWICIWLVSCFFWAPLSAMADPDILPSDVFLVVMLKALNYDRNIDRLSQGKIVIGIVYMNGDAQARDFAARLENDFLDIKAKSQIKNLPVEIRLLSVDKNVGKKTVEEQLKRDHISAVVLTGKDQDINKIVFETTRDMGINSVCDSAACVKQGSGLGIVLKDNKPRMLVNLSVVRQEGSDYGAKFLALCEVVE